MEPAKHCYRKSSNREDQMSDYYIFNGRRSSSSSSLPAEMMDSGRSSSSYSPSPVIGSNSSSMADSDFHSDISEDSLSQEDVTSESSHSNKNSPILGVVHQRSRLRSTPSQAEKNEADARCREKRHFQFYPKETTSSRKRDSLSHSMDNISLTDIPEDLHYFKEEFMSTCNLGQMDRNATIRSAKGTVRGHKFKVREGINNFQSSPVQKKYIEREKGKVILYTTSMGVIRETYAKCNKVKHILHTLLVQFEIRDVFMNLKVQNELKERMETHRILVPQLFYEGQLLGDADKIQKLNESGELREILEPYKRNGPQIACEVCGGSRYVLCTKCHGSKKSHRPLISPGKWSTLRCTKCDETGMICCHLCNN